ncbi:MAG: LysR family transcriptional regulator [Proteobacteria bacterium]|nr:LysR family transcriptional regulator [Pseudomonadota bacterium]
MPRSLPPLNSLRTFEAAARLGSFTKAARELNVTPAAVSHQIRGLEEYLGVMLFRRTTRSLVLTDQATAAAETLHEAFDRISQSVESLRPSGRSGKSGALSISVTPAFATRWLVSRLPHFQKRHPRIHLRIAASPSPVDFDQEDVDVAVRIGRGGFAGVVAVDLFHEWLAPVASPAFLRQNVLRRPVDITRVPMLHDNSMRRAGRPGRGRSGSGSPAPRSRRSGAERNSTTGTLPCRRRRLGAAWRSVALSMPSMISQQSGFASRCNR